eukprot:1270880-Alexandrium_andersonii.AAC.1
MPRAVDDGKSKRNKHDEKKQPRVKQAMMPAHSPDFAKLVEKGVSKEVLALLLLVLLNPALPVAGPIDGAELFAG